MFYLRLFIGADEAVSSTSRPEEFSSPHTNMYFTNVLFPEPPMFELNNWNSDLFFDKSTTEYSSKLSSLNTIVLSFAFSSNYHLEGLSEISYNQWFYQLWIFIWKIKLFIFAYHPIYSLSLYRMMYSPVNILGFSFWLNETIYPHSWTRNFISHILLIFSDKNRYFKCS